MIYTDGNEWALFGHGERVGKTIRFSGDVTTDGASAVEQSNADYLFAMLEDFLQWHPIVPSSPRSLAKLLAPICRLLRTDVLNALQDPNSNLSSLVKDWRIYLFPESDDPTCAELTYRPSHTLCF